MSLTLDQYHEKKLDLQTKIANSFKNFSSKGKEKMTRGQVQARIEALNNYLKSFKYNHKAIIKIPGLDKNHLYFTTKLLDLVEDIYYEVTTLTFLCSWTKLKTQITRH